MGEIKDGGPAFPLEYDGYNQDKFSNPGMTLRDWFAGKVVVGIMRTCDEIHGTAVNRDDIAMEAYRMADAMLRAREGK